MCMLLSHVTAMRISESCKNSPPPSMSWIELTFCPFQTWTVFITREIVVRALHWFVSCLPCNLIFLDGKDFAKFKAMLSFINLKGDYEY